MNLEDSPATSFARHAFQIRWIRGRLLMLPGLGLPNTSASRKQVWHRRALGRRAREAVDVVRSALGGNRARMASRTGRSDPVAVSGGDHHGREGMTVNAFLVWDPETKAAALFDTGFEADPIEGVGGAAPTPLWRTSSSPIPTATMWRRWRRCGAGTRRPGSIPDPPGRLGEQRLVAGEVISVGTCGLRIGKRQVMPRTA